MHQFVVINQQDVALLQLKAVAETGVIEGGIEGIKSAQVISFEGLPHALMPLLNPVAHVAQGGAIGL